MPTAKFATIAALVGTLLLGFAAPALAQQLDKVRFGTNWVAQAEHGGFYQAIADGTYKKYGLDVTIVPGGPNVNNRILLPVGKIDFFMSANSLQGFDAVAQNIPTIAVAAAFQKDPQVLLAHPGQFAHLSGLPRGARKVTRARAIVAVRGGPAAVGRAAHARPRARASASDQPRSRSARSSAPMRGS